MPKPNRALQSKAVNKTAYVLRLPASLSAKEVVAEGKRHGVNLSVAHVYKIRSVGKLRAKAAASKVGARGKAPAAGRLVAGHSSAAARNPVLTARHEMHAARRHGSVEAEFLSLVLELGLSKAGQLLQRVRDKAKGLSL